MFSLLLFANVNPNIFFLIIAFVIVTAFISNYLDKDRIKGYIKEKGGEIVSIEWKIFGKGWFGEKGERIYFIVYKDKYGREFQAWCKTSMFSGVYFTEEKLTDNKNNNKIKRPSYDQLEKENEKLKEDLEKIKESSHKEE